MIDFSLSQEESYESSSDAQEGHYEGYRDRELPDGYTPYAQNCNSNVVNEYDRYDSDYEESPGDGWPKRGFCQRFKSSFNDLGRLVQFFQKKR